MLCFLCIFCMSCFHLEMIFNMEQNHQPSKSFSDFQIYCAEEVSCHFIYQLQTLSIYCNHYYNLGLTFLINILICQSKLSSQLQSTQMDELSIVLCIALICSLTLCGQCDMTSTVGFQDCVYFCINKYGQDPDTQRKFYNRYTGMCQKAVTCTRTPYRFYQNRCLNDFQSFTIGDMHVSLPQNFAQIEEIIVHGNPTALYEEDKCYPGYYSSKKRVQIGVQVYQLYECDIPIGSDPETYPTSHGQYFFYRLEKSVQLDVLNLYCPQNFPMDPLFVFLSVTQFCFVISIIHYHIKLCCRKGPQRNKKTNQDQQDE